LVVASKLVKEAIGLRVNSDNTTVVVIALNNGVVKRIKPVQILDE
jgi:hypothetical protein